MAAASSRFRSVREEDLDSLLIKAVPEKTKAATKYGMKIFHVKNRRRKTTSMNLLFIETLKSTNYIFKSFNLIDAFFVNKF